MINDYFSLAIGNLRHRGVRSWLTILGIFIGIAAVVSLITMGQGLETAILGQFGTLSVDKLTIQNQQTGFAPPGSAVVEKLNDHDIDIVERVSGVDLTLPRILRVMNVEYNEKLRFTYIASQLSDRERIEIVYESFDAKIAEGKLLEARDRGKVLLGSDFANDETFNKRIKPGNRLKINGKEFEVIGILKPTGTFTINGAILMFQEDMEDLLEIKGEYDFIVTQVKDKYQIERVAEEIEQRMRKDRNEKEGEESFNVETPLQALDSVKDILNIVNIVVIGIAAISLFVGGIGIANTMYTSVVERTKEIGIMKAVGAGNKDILFLFLIEAGLLGLVGGLVGAIIGLSVAIGASSIANQALGTELLKVSISYPLLIGAVAFSFLVGTLAGILPAIQASKLKVVDALRK